MEYAYADKTMFDATRCFLLDMDGTFYLGEALLPGALEFVERVERTGRDYRFLTNNTSHNADYYVEKLARLGLSVTRDRVLTAGDATAAKVSRLYGDRPCFVLGNSYFADDLRRGGVRVDNENAEVVVIGFDTTLDYKKMTAVCDLVRAGAPYIASHPDFNCPIPGGFLPDIGAIIAFIEASTGRRPDLIVGKPYTGIVDYILERTGAALSECAMVGDRLYTDIATGINAGMTSVLVMCGETTEEMRLMSKIRPDYVFRDLLQMTEYL